MHKDGGGWREYRMSRSLLSAMTVARGRAANAVYRQSRKFVALDQRFIRKQLGRMPETGQQQLIHVAMTIFGAA
jgi:hypothetical protein